MACVYQATHVVLGRAVAIKILPPAVAADADARTRLQREARSVASLRHSHILEIFDAGEVEGLPYLVTELVTGGTLADQLRVHRASSERLGLALTTARTIGSALDYAHRQGVLHRDVKPSNILLTDSGRLILADFGLAQVREATIRVTQSGDFWGSPHYSSPEQVQGGALSSSSDLYSLGVILYEILSGRVPFAADTPMATALAHIHRPPPAVRALAPGMPQAADTVLAKALAKPAPDRYPTGAALTEAIAAVATEAGAADSTPSWSQPATQFASEIPTIHEDAWIGAGGAPEAPQTQRSYRWAAETATALARLAVTPALRLATAALSVVAVILLAGQLVGAGLLAGGSKSEIPQVIEASPPDGALGVTVQPELELRFNTSMDPASVEAALAIEPWVPVRYEWQNDGTRLLIVPAEPLTAVTEYVLHLGLGARDLQGQALAGAPIERRFITDEPRTMLVNVVSREATEVGGFGGLAYPPIAPDVEHVSVIKISTDNVGEAAEAAALGKAADEGSPSGSASATLSRIAPPVATPIPSLTHEPLVPGSTATTPPPVPLPRAR
ncbi:MAG: hypothetical protein CL878_02825 [Dehalococcoidia bacterium]|nr:hypothetical protein [Dehalococcoidia bacterium]